MNEADMTFFKKRFSIFLFSIIFGMATFAHSAVNIKLEVKETAGIGRTVEMIHNGIPIARTDNLTHTGNLIVEDATGSQISATFEVLSRWAGDRDDLTKEIRWLLVSFPATVPANTTANYYLKTGNPSLSGPLISLIENAGSYIVDTGAAEFAINKNSLSLSQPQG